MEVGNELHDLLEFFEPKWLRIPYAGCIPSVRFPCYLFFSLKIS